jgi:hypothetical protein
VSHHFLQKLSEPDSIPGTDARLLVQHTPIPFQSYDDLVAAISKIGDICGLGARSDVPPAGNINVRKRGLDSDGEGDRLNKRQVNRSGLAGDAVVEATKVPLTSASVAHC